MDTEGKSADGSAVSSAATTRVCGSWLILARSAWVVFALLLLANFVVSIPAYYRLLSAVCPLADHGQCTTNTNASGQLALGTVQILAHLHISLSSYAASFTTMNVMVSLLGWGVGLLIFWRKSDEAMGLLVSLLLVLFGAAGCNNTLLGAWAPAHPSPLLSTLIDFLSGAQWIGLGAFLLTFPTGHGFSRWSWLIFFCWITSFVGNQGTQTPLDLLGVTGFLAVGGTLGIVVYRYLRVFTALQRQQAKWFVFSAVAGLSSLTISPSVSSVVPVDSPFQLVFLVFTILVPGVFLYLGLGFAMFRYRLWDIDIIIKKTLVYALLTLILVLLYAGLVFGAQALLVGLIGKNDGIVIVGSTLIVAILFQPLRRGIQNTIDRRFYRQKYDAQRTLQAFSDTLQQEIDLVQLSEQIVAVVQETMQPAHVSLWLVKSVRMEHGSTPLEQ